MHRKQIFFSSFTFCASHSQQIFLHTSHSVKTKTKTDLCILEKLWISTFLFLLLLLIESSDYLFMWYIWMCWDARIARASPHVFDCILKIDALVLNIYLKVVLYFSYLLSSLASSILFSLLTQVSCTTQFVRNIWMNKMDTFNVFFVLLLFIFISILYLNIECSFQLLYTKKFISIFRWIQSARPSRTTSYRRFNGLFPF